MESAIEQRWRQSEARMEALIKRVVSLPEERSRLRPRPKEFSPADVVEHMALTEAMYVHMLAPKSQGRPVRPNALYRITLRKLESGGRMPTFGSLTPKESVPAQLAAESWRRVRQEIAAALQGAVPELQVLRHPLFGKLSAHHLCDLLDAHVTYHEIRFPA